MKSIYQMELEDKFNRKIKYREKKLKNQRMIIGKQQEVIEKLNNIINELEKEFDKTIKDPLIHSCYKRISREYFDKLQELKGSNKE